MYIPIGILVIIGIILFIKEFPIPALITLGVIIAGLILIGIFANKKK